MSTVMNPTSKTMKTAMKIRILLVSALIAASSFASSNQASAQEVQVTGPLANQPAVRNMRLYRAGRFQLEPNFSFGLQSEFTRPLIAGLHLGYYFTDWLGIGVWGGYTVANLDTGLTSEIEEGGITTPRNALSLPSRSGFADQIATTSWMAALQLEFSPLRGKLAIFEKLFVDTDFYIFVGAAVLGIEERSDVTRNQCNNLDCFVGTQTQRSNRVAVAATFGAGLSMYFNNFIGLNFNWRGLPYSSNSSGWDDSNSDDGTDFGDGQINSDDRFFKLHHLFTVGIVIYLPTDPQITE